MTKKARKTPGRPRLPPAEKKHEPLGLKVSPAELELIYRAARSDGYAPYTWCRRTLVQAARKVLGLTAEK